MNLREQILQIQDLKEETFKVPEWAMDITIRELSARDVNDVQKYLSKLDKNVPLLITAAVYACFGIIDPITKKRVFSESDIPAITDKSPTVLYNIFIKLNKLSGGSESVEDQAKN
jgi:hypothetical protein